MSQYPSFNKAHSREEVRPRAGKTSTEAHSAPKPKAPAQASTNKKTSKADDQKTVDQKTAKKAPKKETPADATNETSENRATKGREISYKLMSRSWKSTKSYNHLGAAMFVNETHKEERTEFYGEAKDKKKFESKEKEDGKVVTYVAGRGNTLVVMSKNDPKKVYPAIPKDVKGKREWRVSVSFKKDSYKLAEVLHDDPNLVLKGSAVEVAKGGKHFVTFK